MILDGYDLHCRHCAVWKPKEQMTFATYEEAEQHVLTFHPDRLLKQYQGVVKLLQEKLKNEGIDVRLVLLDAMLSDIHREGAFRPFNPPKT